MKNRIIGLILIMVMVLSLAACSNSAPSSEDKDTASTAAPQQTEQAGVSGSEQEQSDANAAETDAEVETFAPYDGVRELVVGISGDIVTWDPWGSFNVGRQNMAPIIYQSLTADIANQETYEITHYNVLAESTERIENGVYRIKIRDGVYDTAGYPFTAEDAIFSFQTCIDKGVLSQVKIIDHMELEDELTFLMYLTIDNVDGFTDVCAAINMVTKESYESSPDEMQTTPVGTSPMKLESYTAGSEAVMVRSDNYWNEAANESKNIEDGYCNMWDFSDLDRVIYKFITNTTSLEIALENGEIDITKSIASEDVESFENSDTCKPFYHWDGLYGLAFNVSDNSPCADKNLRLAIAHAVDAESCLAAACDMRGEVATSWSFKTFFDYQDEWTDREYFDYNMDKAKEYLAAWEKETGKSASALNLRLLYQAEDVVEATALAIQNFIGILTGNPNCVTLTSYDRGTYTSEKKNSDTFDITIVNGQLTTRTHSTYNWNAECNTNVNGYNIFHDNSGAIDKVIEPVMAMETHSDETVKAFQDFIDENCYFKALFCEIAYGACANWIHNTGAVTGAKGMLNIGGITYDWANSGK